MRVADVLLSLRSRLRDRDGETWSDVELIDTMNDAFLDIAADASPIKKLDMRQISADTDNVELPSDYGSLKLVYVNSTPVTINEIETALVSGESGSAYVSGKNLYFIGGLSKNAQLKMLYAVAPEIYAIEDDFPLPRWFRAAVLVKCMAIALLQKPGEKDFPNVQFLENLYNKTLDKAISSHAAATNPTTHKSTFQKV